MKNLPTETFSDLGSVWFFQDNMQPGGNQPVSYSCHSNHHSLSVSQTVGMKGNIGRATRGERLPGPPTRGRRDTGPPGSLHGRGCPSAHVSQPSADIRYICYIRVNFPPYSSSSIHVAQGHVPLCLEMVSSYKAPARVGFSSVPHGVCHTGRDGRIVSASLCTTAAAHCPHSHNPNRSCNSFRP